MYDQNCWLLSGKPVERMPDEGEGEESVFLGKVVYIKYRRPLDPQEHSDLQPVVARAQVADALLIQTRESCKVPQPC